MQIDHIHFYVENAEKWRDWFVQIMGFQAIASGNNQDSHTEVVISGQSDKNTNANLIFLISSPLRKSSPVTQFLRCHPPGVADVAFQVPDLAKILQQGTKLGVKIQQPIQKFKSSQGEIKIIKIRGIANLNHTLIERQGKTPLLPQKWLIKKPLLPATEVNFTGIDHLVLNVGVGELEKTVTWYEKAFGFERQQTFTIQTEQSALYSQVMVHPVSGVQFPINEPMSANSQIQEFLDINRGPGIQHIALKTSQIIKVTKKLRAAGLSFLKTPLSYYEYSKENNRLIFSEEEWQEIFKQGILVDWEEKNREINLKKKHLSPLLLQIFTQPIFEQPTFFFELIERRHGAKGFGNGNFQALFEAIEREQIKRGSLVE
jgi:4-hydroxyphenylpyruvate dioxygenase